MRGYNITVNFQAESDTKAHELAELMCEAFANQSDGNKIDNFTLVKIMAQN